MSENDIGETTVARQVVFVDRDNTLIEDPGYISDPNQVVLIDGAAQAVARLRKAGYPVVVVTNQSGIARGMFTEVELVHIHQRMQDLLNANGSEVDAIYYCPYLDGPDAKVSAYRRASELRKPKPGMLKLAARVMNIDLAASWMVGDSGRDVEAGRAAGCRTVLIGSSEGLNGDPPPDYIVADLAAAADVILGLTSDAPVERPPESISPEAQESVAEGVSPDGQPLIALPDEVLPETPSDGMPSDASPGMFEETLGGASEEAMRVACDAGAGTGGAPEIEAQAAYAGAIESGESGEASEAPDPEEVWGEVPFIEADPKPPQSASETRESTSRSCTNEVYEEASGDAGMGLHQDAAPSSLTEQAFDMERSYCEGEEAAADDERYKTGERFVSDRSIGKAEGGAVQASREDAESGDMERIESLLEQLLEETRMVRRSQQHEDFSVGRLAAAIAQAVALCAIGGALYAAIEQGPDSFAQVTFRLLAGIAFQLMALTWFVASKEK